METFIGNGNPLFATSNWVKWQRCLARVAPPPRVKMRGNGRGRDAWRASGRRIMSAARRYARNNAPGRAATNKYVIIPFTSKSNRGLPAIQTRRVAAKVAIWSFYS